MWNNTPWFVDGGSHSPEVARLLAYAATSGAEGIVGITDLKVQALNIPGTSVRVAPGGALILNRYAGGGQQTYVGLNPIEHHAPVTATTSAGGRTDLVVARIDDPQYSGQEAADPLTYQYIYTEIIQNVPANTRTARELNLGYPAIALARITIPAATGTITAAMITDLREVALPRRTRTLHSIYGQGNKNTTGHVIPTGSYQSWPITNAQRPLVWVPEWATHMDVVGHYSGVYYVRSTDSNDTIAGIRTGFGSEGGENGILIEDGASAGGRFHYTVVGSHNVPADMRGTWQNVNLQAVRSAGTGRWYSDYQTSISVDIEFSEQAD